VPVYSFEAMDSQGREVRDQVEARTDAEAAEKIRRKGLFPTRIQARGAGGTVAPVAVGRKVPRVFMGRVTGKELTQFTRQFSTLMDAGLPIVRSLDILQNQMKPGLLKATVAQVREDVEGGSSLSEAMSRHPRAFDKLYVNMVKAGEAGGVLDTILTRLADFREKSMKLQRQVIGALIYPTAVITIAVAILSIIIAVVIPQFEKMFADLGQAGKLPAPTKLLIGVTDVLRSFWFLLPGVPFGLWLTFRFIVMNPRGRYMVDKMKLHVPIFGIVTRKSSISRFARTLGTLIASGVPILEALNIIKGTTGNAVVANAVGEVHNSIREGDTIAEPLKHSGVFDDIVVNMIDVGEETGELDKMLIKIADNYDNEVDALVGGLMSLLEPFLIIGMGLAVGFIVIALFLPLIGLMQTIGSES
jgi:type IV pilus assembly protein PilC